MGEQQRNAEVLQALDDVPPQAAGIGQQLRYGVDFGPLQGHPPGHNQADVAGAEDHHVPPRQPALQIDQPLGRARRIDPGRAEARDVQRAPGPLPAAHGQNHRPGLPAPQSAGAHRRDGPVRRQREDHGIGLLRNPRRPHPVQIPPGIFRAGQLLAEGVEAEAVVNALVQNAAGIPVPFENQNILHPGLPGRQRCRQPRRAAPNDDQITVFHAAPPLPWDRPAARTGRRTWSGGLFRPLPAAP